LKMKKRSQRNHADIDDKINSKLDCYISSLSSPIREVFVKIVNDSIKIHFVLYSVLASLTASQVMDKF